MAYENRSSEQLRSSIQSAAEEGQFRSSIGDKVAEDEAHRTIDRRLDELERRGDLTSDGR
jgi:hypothetical protein